MRQQPLQQAHFMTIKIRDILFLNYHTEALFPKFCMHSVWQMHVYCEVRIHP